MGPSFAYLLVFFVWPMVQAGVLSFQDAQGAASLHAFFTMVSDINFQPAIKDTLILTIVTVAIQTVFAVFMALVLTSGIRGTSIFLYIWSIPLGISDLASGLAWLAIFTDHGYVNTLLVDAGLKSFPFLSYQQPVTLFMVVIISELWRATSIVMVILVAGLQGIPRDFGEAAEVFGAGWWQRLRHVTLPLLKPSMQVALILRIIAAFQIFGVVIALAGANLPVLTGEAYFWYGQYRNVHVAADYSLLILLFGLLSTTLVLRALRVQDQQVGLVK